MEGTVKEAIVRVRSEFKLQTQDDLEDCSDRFIMNELLSTALKFIKQTTDKRKLWNSPNIFTTFPCISLQQVPLSECIAYTKIATIARSVVKLPRIAEGTNFGMLIQGVWSIDQVSRRFIESTPDRYRNALDLEHTGNQIHFFLQDGYLYIGDDSITQVKMAAYIEQDIPQDFIWYPDYCYTANAPIVKGCCPQSKQVNSNTDLSACCPPNPYNQPFRAPGYMQDDIIKEVANKLLSTFKRSQNDNKLPGKDTEK